MLQWMRAHKSALLVSCGMFAVMAVLMAEAFMLGDESNIPWFEDEFSLPIWIWRIGGTVTWPVFVWLLLKPHADGSAESSKVLTVACIAAAAYGGFGLWAASRLFMTMVELADRGAFLAPLVALFGMVLPFLYTWGFVGLYGFARARLAGRTDDYGWVGMSAVATVVGVYGIGALVYLAMAAVALPVALVVTSLASVGFEDAAWHMAVDMIAVAISTGNFVTQWWAFMKVDEHFDKGPAAEGVASSVPFQPTDEPVAQAEKVPVPQTDKAPVARQPLPRLVCTCGQELTLDESQLPRYVAKEQFCPSCGARIAH